jgi:hypothetical protein
MKDLQPFSLSISGAGLQILRSGDPSFYFFILFIHLTGEFLPVRWWAHIILLMSLLLL